MAKQMVQYHELLSRILFHGEDQINERTGKVCRYIVGEQLKFDLEKSCPVLTSRKIPVISTIGELTGFFKGYASARQFREVGCGFWDSNANATQAWLDNPFRKGEDDLGEIYGHQWTKWQSVRLLNDLESTKEQVQYLKDKGWDFLSATTIADERYIVTVKVINQLEEVVKKILTDPTDRRIIVTGWNPGAMYFQALPACHTEYVFTPSIVTKKLHLTMRMRSTDAAIGVPANILSSSAFLSVVAKLTGYTPSTLTIQMANVHIYDDHLEGVRETLSRDLLDEPSLIISDRVPTLESPAQVKGVFNRIDPTDIYLTNYINQGPLKAKMPMAS